MKKNLNSLFSLICSAYMGFSEFCYSQNNSGNLSSNNQQQNDSLFIYKNTKEGTNTIYHSFSDSYLYLLALQGEKEAIKVYQDSRNFYKKHGFQLIITENGGSWVRTTLPQEKLSREFLKYQEAIQENTDRFIESRQELLLNWPNHKDIYSEIRKELGLRKDKVSR
jgi:predicted dehydrogenase